MKGHQCTWRPAGEAEIRELVNNINMEFGDCMRLIRRPEVRHAQVCEGCMSGMVETATGVASGPLYTVVDELAF